MAETSALLKALTPEAKAALGGRFYKIPHFPFKVGRESRLSSGPQEFTRLRRPDSVPNNDLYLIDHGTILSISREHFLIDIRDESYVLVDRGSSCGTIVEGEPVGEKRSGGTVRLNDGDVIIVGKSESKYIFKFIIKTE